MNQMQAKHRPVIDVMLIFGVLDRQHFRFAEYLLHIKIISKPRIKAIHIVKQTYENATKRQLMHVNYSSTQEFMFMYFCAYRVNACEQFMPSLCTLYSTAPLYWQK